MDYVIKDYTNIASSSKTSLAMLSLMDERTYEKVKHDLSTAGSYAYIFSGSTNYIDFKEKINREIAYSSYQYNQETSLNYLSEQLSPQVNDLYATCMKNDSTILGLRIWLTKHVGVYYELSAEWIGGTAGVDLAGTFNGKIEDGLKVLSPIPAKWPRAAPFDLVVKKTTDDKTQAALILTVGKDNATFIIVPDPIVEEYDFKSINIAPILVNSGGYWKAGPQPYTKCEPPPEGGKWVPGFAKKNNEIGSGNPGNSAVINSQDEYSICWTVTAFSGDQDKTVSESAGILALARFSRKKEITMAPVKENMILMPKR